MSKHTAEVQAQQHMLTEHFDTNHKDLVKKLDELATVQLLRIIGR